MDVDIKVSDVHKIQHYTKTKQFILESELKKLEFDVKKMNQRLLQLQARALKYHEHGGTFKKSIYPKVKEIANGNLKIWRKVVNQNLERRNEIIQLNVNRITDIKDKIKKCNEEIKQRKEALQHVERKKMMYDELLVLINDAF